MRISEDEDGRASRETIGWLASGEVELELIERSRWFDRGRTGRQADRAQNAQMSLSRPPAQSGQARASIPSTPW